MELPEIQAYTYVYELLLELYEIKCNKNKSEFRDYFFEKFRVSMTNACDVIGHGFSEVDQLEMSMSMTRDSLKRCIEGNIDDIDEVDSNEFAALVKLDCNIQCNKTLHKPISVCKL